LIDDLNVHFDDSGYDDCYCLWQAFGQGS